jgi:hypothetical protein
VVVTVTDTWATATGVANTVPTATAAVKIAAANWATTNWGATSGGGTTTTAPATEERIRVLGVEHRQGDDGYKDSSQRSKLTTHHDFSQKLF